MWPSIEVAETFSVRVVAPLGGRLNQHWLVDAGGERLVLRRWATPADDVTYELRLLARVAALGWPVAPAVAGPVELDGHLWGLFPFLPGELPPTPHGSSTEQRARGRLLAAFHADLARLGDLGQRPGWRRCETILTDPALDRVLGEREQAYPEEIRLLRWRLDRARARLAGLCPQERPGQLIHGDFTTWNLRFQGSQLTGILDFELAH